MGAAAKIEGAVAIGLSILGTASLVIASVGYTTLLPWRTATARDLPGWFSLLTWVPGISLFVYPIMAFHDGWARPHRIGGAIGALLVLAFVAPSIHLVRGLDEEAFSAGLAKWAESE